MRLSMAGDEQKAGEKQQIQEFHRRFFERYWFER
jgi:hypothetical protein